MSAEHARLSKYKCTCGRRHIFVFASNLAGHHGKGSALEALKNHGARRACSEGLFGNSYAIPTKTDLLKTLSLAKIRMFVNTFLTYAQYHPGMHFDVVKIGTGEAGYTGADEVTLALMFRERGANVSLHPDWELILTKEIGNVDHDPQRQGG